LEITDLRSRITFLPLPEDDPKQRKPDITRAQTLLQWKPKVDLRTGLRLTLDAMAAEVHPAVGEGVKRSGEPEPIIISPQWEEAS
jgi:hypothetical protein